MLGKSWHETTVKRLSAAGLTHALHTPYTRLRPRPSGFNTESVRHTGASAENRTDRPTGGSEPPFSPLAPRAPPRHAPAPATRRGRDVKPVGALAPAGWRAEGWASACAGGRPRPARAHGSGSGVQQVPGGFVGSPTVAKRWRRTPRGPACVFCTQLQYDSGSASLFSFRELILFILHVSPRSICDCLGIHGLRHEGSDCLWQ